MVLLYHWPLAFWHRNASTVLEHVGAFRRHSRFPILEVNVDAGFPPALERVEPRAMIMHYSLFGVQHYLLDDQWLAWLARSRAYKIAFFQDEHFACRRRFNFLNDFQVDCVYTCLEPSEFSKVYGAYTEVPKLVSNLPGYVSEGLLETGQRFTLPDGRRPIDVGYRGRPLAVYMGRGAQEKHLIGRRFAELAAGSGLRLDIAGGEGDRLYGDDWYRFISRCRAVLGVESGVSAFDLEGEVYAEYVRLLEERGAVGIADLESLSEWEDVVYYRTISPRHFEAAALRACQVLFEGRYSGILQPMVHYIPLEKDFSNMERVIALIKDAEVRGELTRNAHRDLIASGEWGYERLIESVDGTLQEAGVSEEPDSAGQAALRSALRRGALVRRTRRQLDWLLRALLSRPLVIRAARLVHPVTSRVRRLMGPRAA